jgi:hypothetical protein
MGLLNRGPGDESSVATKLNSITKAGNKKTKTMGRNRREGVLPAWRVRMIGQQRKYARRLADWLACKTANVPPKRLRVYMVAVLLGIAAVNFLVLLHATSLHQPAVQYHYVRSGAVELRLPAWPGGELKRWLDSVKADPVAGQQLDSLFRLRPGLADSLRRLEEWVR